MGSHRFDSISKMFAKHGSRRQVVAGGFALVAGASASRTLAQGATPEASPVPAEPGFAQKFLFVQTAESGTWQPKADQPDTYILTLTGAAAQTVYFSDRPERIVGTVPMQRFLDTLGFTPDNPPNAAVVTGSGDDEDVLVIELRNPSYDADLNTLTYDAQVLGDYQEDGLSFVAERQQDTDLPESFGTASVFIDDCNDIVNCRVGALANVVGPVPGGPIGTCWSPKRIECRPCDGNTIRYYSQICNETYPDDCAGLCYVSVE